MSYRIPCSTVVAETEEKKSRFICWLGPVEDKADFQQQLNVVRTQYPDATHHCTALVIGNPANPEVMLSDDDGEPGGSAGRPMLELLLKQEIGNVGAIVTRYFGGTKLGVGGLMRAYRGAVGAALQSVELTTFIPLRQVSVTCDFAQESRLRFLADQHGGKCIDAVYSEKVTVQIELPEDRLAAFRKQLVAEGLHISMAEE
ncbi:YigZ family protein [Microbulbifer thermotolerans]|uniref:YigZ family protein n=1 Tax=Microbulbifer thermotolerans TaxID=252514 RepID=UPI0008F045B6|nr:YigZ family protein [Microbulbifer thermotolerans]MCX2779636.1 YigZ family protein [Microbulbifer thermotolerans]MCX2782602.1 YigZ family protein [Microbulbifer thermotolerans]MCX2794614.1 YigZ family protein [Microbulbifer thermotolerans]MCX2804933.1 YigZ family protein [Microbulbifer thermotolerans]MCX2833890.1 YigZ family protein [Microbulbifer thermotolerans]